MPKYAVVHPIRHGRVSGGLMQVENYAEGEQIELSEREAQELLECGSIAALKAKKEDEPK